MASPLYDKLMEDLKAAMKAHDKAALNAIRGTIAKVKDLTVNAGKEIVDDVVVQVVAKGVKQRDESIAQFTTAGRADLAEGEKAEREVLARRAGERLADAQAHLARRRVGERDDEHLLDRAALLHQLHDALHQHRRLARPRRRADDEAVPPVCDGVLLLLRPVRHGRSLLCLLRPLYHTLPRAGNLFCSQVLTTNPPDFY